MTTIGVDVGGTKTHAIAFDEHFAVLAERRVPTHVGNGAQVTDTIVETVNELRADLVARRVDRIGIGIPGRVDPIAGSVTQAVNLGIGSEPVSLAEQVAMRCAAPCWIENDVNVAALGTHRIIGDAEGAADLTYLSVGTGIAAGVVLGGAIHRGARGVAGEIGHLPVVADGLRCSCGLRGCLETVSSGAAIAHAWPVPDGESAATALLVAASAGEQRAIDILRPVADQLAFAIYTLALTFDVEQIVVGGGVAEAGQLLIDAILGSIAQLEESSEFVRSLELRNRVRLAPAGHVGVVGAAALAEAGAS